MTNEPDGLKFIYAEIENFKNIEKRTIEIQGRSLILIGKNGSGKSSLMQALMSPLDSKIIPSKPIKKGEERATVKVVMGGNIKGKHEEYTMDIFFTPANQRGRIVLTNEAGETMKAPATLIKGLIGNISFDIFDFLNGDKKGKIKILKDLTGRKDEIEIIEEEIASKKESKRNLEAVINNDGTLLNNHGYTQEQIDMYSVAIDIAPLQNQLNSVSKNIDEHANLVSLLKGLKDEKIVKTSRVSDIEVKIESNKESISDLKEKIAKLTEENESLSEERSVINGSFEQLNTRILKGENYLDTNPAPSAAAISDAITKATEHNNHCAKISEYAGKQKALIENKKKLQKSEADIKALEDKKTKVISSSQLPVQGLTFTDDEIYMDGLPLEEGQVNTAKLIDIGTDIAMAMNPSLKVIFVPDGSMFDKPSLRALIEKIESRGYMAIVEYVSPDGGELEVKFSEEVI